MQFHILSFEGPDAYARAGGISSRIGGLTEALVQAGFETHLWFVGDPKLSGNEKVRGLHLHRWCQWISAEHAHGVYDGEDRKAQDYAASLPPYLLREVLGKALLRGERAVVLAEEWHTADAVLHLDHLLQRAQVRHQVSLMWNANNTFGFHRIDWGALQQAATVTTVSRYMKHLMRVHGVNPWVIPNGLGSENFVKPAPEHVSEVRQAFSGRVMLAKMARFDPDKQWLLAIDTVGELKRQGARPILVARGGIEAHGDEVMARAAVWGLRVENRQASRPGVDGILAALRKADQVDIINLKSHLDPDSRRVLFCGADAVLANSTHEPFGLVGLETMAAGGIACTGCSGEDYAIGGRNAMVLQSTDPREFVQQFAVLKRDPGVEQAMRDAGRRTAEDYAWSAVLEGNLMPRLQLMGAGLR